MRRRVTVLDYGSGNVRSVVRMLERVGAEVVRGKALAMIVESATVKDASGNDLDLDDSWGLALHAGLDYRVSDKGALRTDVRWMNIESDVKLNGVDIGKAKINPWVFGVSYVHTF